MLSSLWLIQTPLSSCLVDTNISETNTSMISLRLILAFLSSVRLMLTSWSSLNWWWALWVIPSSLSFFGTSIARLSETDTSVNSVKQCLHLWALWGWGSHLHLCQIHGRLLLSLLLSRWPGSSWLSSLGILQNLSPHFLQRRVQCVTRETQQG